MGYVNSLEGNSFWRNPVTYLTGIPSSKKKRREILPRISQAVSKGGVNWRRWHRWDAQFFRVFKEGPFRLQVFLEVDWEGGSYCGLKDTSSNLQENHLNETFGFGAPRKRTYFIFQIVCLFKVVR